MNLYIRLLFLLMSLNTFVLTVICGRTGKRENDGTRFDFFTFAQMWPITDCELWEWADKSNTCNLPKESKKNQICKNILNRLKELPFIIQGYFNQYIILYDENQFRRYMYLQ